MRALVLSLFLLPALTGCEMLGVELPAQKAKARVSESRAIGAACRHAGRAIEDCYTLNLQADKAAVFAGWREMNDYMRENDIREVVPQLPPPARPTRQAVSGEEDYEDEEYLPPSRGRQDGGIAARTR